MPSSRLPKWLPATPTSLLPAQDFPILLPVIYVPSAHPSASSSQMSTTLSSSKQRQKSSGVIPPSSLQVHLSLSHPYAPSSPSGMHPLLHSSTLSTSLRQKNSGNQGHSSIFCYHALKRACVASQASLTVYPLQFNASGDPK